MYVKKYALDSDVFINNIIINKVIQINLWRKLDLLDRRYNTYNLR